MDLILIGAICSRFVAKKLGGNAERCGTCEHYLNKEEASVLLGILFKVVNIPTHYTNIEASCIAAKGCKAMSECAFKQRNAEFINVHSWKVACSRCVSGIPQGIKENCF